MGKRILMLVGAIVIVAWIIADTEPIKKKPEAMNEAELRAVQNQEFWNIVTKGI